MSVDNTQIANFLQKLSDYYKTIHEHRYRTFAEAADKIAKSQVPITSGVQAQQMFTRIGPSVVKEINEFLATGTSQRMLELEKDYGQTRLEILQELQTVHGIGDKNAVKFYDIGVRSINDLYQLDNLTTAMKIGLYFNQDSKMRIPRKEIDAVNQYLQQVFDQYFPDLKWEIAGSYRRGAADSGDIDIIIEANQNFGPNYNFEQVKQLLLQTGLIPFVPNIGYAVLASGPHKMLTYVQLPNQPARRLDLLWIDPEYYPFGLFYFTGSQYFNIVMRELAKLKGWTLNEYRILDTITNQLINKSDGSPIRTEADIFETFGFNYLAPIERNYTPAIANDVLKAYNIDSKVD